MSDLYAATARVRLMEAEYPVHDFELRAGGTGPGKLTGPVVVYGDEAVGPEGSGADDAGVLSEFGR